MLGNPIREQLQALRDGSRQAVLLAEDHVDLFVLEWKAERRRLAGLATSVVIAAVTALLAAGFGAVAVLVAFWDTPYRLMSALGLTGGFGFLCVLAIVRIVVLTDARRRSFERSRQEWALTWELLKERL